MPQHPMDEIITLIEAAAAQGKGVEAVCSTAPPGFTLFMDVAIALFERQPLASQMLAFPLMFAQVCASIEGDLVQAEQESGHFITFEDRLRLFTAQARIIFKEAYEFRSHPDCPKPPTSTVM